mgnify:FL=1
MNTTDKTIIDTLVGHRVTAIASTADQDGNEAAVTLDNGTTLLLLGSEGCGGCINGLVTFPTHDNYAALTGGVIMSATVEDNRPRDEDLVDATIFVWVDDKRLPLLDIDGRDNGWYGLGYTVRVLAPGRTLTEEERQNAHWDARCLPGLEEQ